MPSSKGLPDPGIKLATLTSPALQALSRQVSRGSAGEYQADEQAGVARLGWRVSADEQAGVARLSWRVSGR